MPSTRCITRTDRRASVPVAFGYDVRDWYDHDQGMPVTRGRVAWTGGNPASDKIGRTLRLYLGVWENPHAEKMVASLDFVKTEDKSCAPFCLAITAEGPSSTGEVILISEPDSWQAYYWWLSDDRAPKFARLVDIHRKPGYDPVELHFDMATKSIPLDATLVKGSHGAPAVDRSQRSVILSSVPGLLPGTSLADTDVFDVVLRQFGMAMR